MYERKFTGSKCPSGYVTASVLAKAMRADIKDAIAAGWLPGTARNYTVRVDNFSGGRSIDVRAIDLDGMWERCTGVTHDGRACRNDWCEGNQPGHPSAEVHERLTVVGEWVQAALEHIHSSYNYDASEAQIDYFNVNFWGSAKVETSWQRNSRLAEKARKEARKAAKVAA